MGEPGRSHGKRIEDFSDERKTAAFAAASLAVEDLSPDLAQRLLGPRQFSLGDIRTWSVPFWADADSAVS
ncbi:hypothetical protein [Actinacidiphila paucisporea]|uniref:Uncharacterized protein n=1 Tax=Actinacidiphila paucisporea TaxID=310782 RepID=A0A1M7MJ74_9ACTN|nr:hypothetical protein [Actinacidiphila paucisporea]SHM90475.1 hypothetical protein SAMN05216499_11648 [Actinacidiphila paucisporea]